MVTPDAEGGASEAIVWGLEGVAYITILHNQIANQLLINGLA